MIFGIIASILFFYCLFVFALIIGWFNTINNIAVNKKPELFYSILIPFRNESQNLPELLKSLNELSFPKDHYEVIFIDDHSEDGFNFSNNANHLVLNLKNGKGKKAALSHGIEKAQGDIIVTTDADCQIPQDWLANYAYQFENRNNHLVFGGVTFKDDNTLFKKMQTVEFASLIGSGAATLKWGLPSMCNGANMAFRKDVFKRVGGYSDNENIPSGDDEFLMHKVFALDKKVSYLKRGVTVLTQAQTNFTSFNQQRKRWASKWKHYKNLGNSILAVMVAIFSFNTILAAMAIIFYQDTLITILFALKILFEAFFLNSVLKSLDKKLHIISFIILQISYPIYVLLFGLGANFGQYSWKGRKHKL